MVRIIHQHHILVGDMGRRKRLTASKAEDPASQFFSVDFILRMTFNQQKFFFWKQASFAESLRYPYHPTLPYMSENKRMKVDYKIDSNYFLFYQ